MSIQTVCNGSIAAFNSNPNILYHLQTFFSETESKQSVKKHKYILLQTVELLKKCSFLKV